MRKVEEKIYDLEKLCKIRKVLDSLDPSGLPTVSFLHRPRIPERPSRVGVFSSSFNPLTFAHSVLIEKAIKEFGLDEVALSLSRITVDKERPTGLLLEDRLLSLIIFAEEKSDLSVAALSHGLYVDQVEAFKQACPEGTEIFFIVGYDKIVQVFDPRYYSDRERALEKLFSRSSFIVANRGRGGMDDVISLLDRPENRRYAGFIRTLHLPEEYGDVSSTVVRETVGRGERVGSLVPKEIATFIEETGCYGPTRLYGDEEVAPYEARGVLIGALCSAGFGENRPRLFKSLMRLALSETPRGSELRRAFRESKSTSEVIRSALLGEG
jgi:nicotinic acid mononucleotide adenylyltransferase